MSTCPRCRADAAPGARYCPACGSSLADSGRPPLEPTATSIGPAPGHGADSGASVSGGPSADARPRFAAGEVFAGRFRIVGRLGRGGMGEVYRADDLKLGIPVAIKLLPQALEADPDRLARFLGEARTALRVTHPNVCRVYDIGESDGTHYLSMEYVDGEDLASLLRRIGRLPEERAVEIARSLCAGLAAAHREGILHRDLKPANVMLDGRGEIKITDFGLAGAARTFEGAEIRVGTPAYMAPEQLEGREVTERSDVYALGLVLYELFTGEPAYPSDGTLGSIRARAGSSPTPMRSRVRAIDPAIDAVVTRCLDPDPARRPGNARVVAAALPGGDALEAALAAGETPSPELVAEAGDDGAVGARAASVLAVAALVGLFVLASVTNRVSVFDEAKPGRSAVALEERARLAVESLGYDGDPTDRAIGWYHNRGIVWEIAREDDRLDRWDRLDEVEPAPLGLWYRQSERRLVPEAASGRVEFDTPDFAWEDEVRLLVDQHGELYRLEARASLARSDPDAHPQVPDWSLAFELSGLDPSAFTPVAPERVAPVPCERPAAWTGTYASGDPLRIEACAAGGRVVWWYLVHPWSSVPQEVSTFELDPVGSLQDVLNTGIQLLLWGVGATLAYRNWRSRRADLRGAWIVGGLSFGAGLLAWILRAHHVPEHWLELDALQAALPDLLYRAAELAMIYLAVEPFVRRHWPQILVSWSRLTAGRWRDPLVGRHVLIGTLLGVGIGVLVQLPYFWPVLRGEPSFTPHFPDLGMLLGPRYALAELLSGFTNALRIPLVAVFLLVAFRVATGRTWAAVLLFVAVQTALVMPDASQVWTVAWSTVNAVAFAVGTWALIRTGLVALVPTVFIVWEIAQSKRPVLTPIGGEFAGTTLVVGAVAVAIVVGAALVAAGRLGPRRT